LESGGAGRGGLPPEGSSASRPADPAGADAWAPPTTPAGNLEIGLDFEARLLVGLAAVDAARRGSPTVDAFHLVFVLTCTPAAAAWLRSRGADPRSVAREIDTILGGADARGPSAPAEPPIPWTLSTVRVLRAAARRGDTVGLIEACANPGWASRLKALVGRGDAQTWLHRQLGGPPLATPRPQPAPPGSASVVLHNDPKTSMEFVVDALESTLGRSWWDALSTTFAVHEGGSGVAAVLPVDEARKRADDLLAAARARGFPLVVTVEPG
jgi:ATP-dependent Clp protease adaptor protein ClpS